MLRSVRLNRFRNLAPKHFIEVLAGRCRGSVASARAEPLLLVGPRAGESLGETRDGQAGRSGAVSDRLDYFEREESQRRETADMALGEAFGGGHGVEGCDLSSEDGVHPSARSGDGLEQVPRFGLQARGR